MTTNVFLSQFQLEENSHATPSFKENDGTFCFFSTQVFLSLEYGIIFEIPATFLSVVAQSAEINVSNIQVNGFSSSTPGGGVFDVFVGYSCTSSVKDSFFLNGKNGGSGGILLHQIRRYNHSKLDFSQCFYLQCRWHSVY